jgi:putative flippase GtrA
MFNLGELLKWAGISIGVATVMAIAAAVLLCYFLYRRLTSKDFKDDSKPQAKPILKYSNRGRGTI